MTDYIVSADAGNGGTNAVMAKENGKYKRYYEPSVRAMATGDSLGLGLQFEMEYEYVDWYGSRYVTGDAGSGESEIRRWILEKDWLEALIALPEQLFYNTGIATYVWILTNNKPPERQGYVQLINATDLWVPMRKSPGDKRREISHKQIEEIRAIYAAFDPDNPRNKIFLSTHFGYRKITVERPLRLNFHKNRSERLWEQTAFQSLAVSKKRKDSPEKAAEEAAGYELQQSIFVMLDTLPDELYLSRSDFLKDLKAAARHHDIKLTGTLEKAIIAALGEADENADICYDKDGSPEADSNLRDYENVPLDESIENYFEREVLPYVPDAWMNTDVRDHRDKEIGKVGYEINFNRYFYVYKPPRPLEEIEADIKRLEREIMKMLQEVTKS